MIAQTESSTYPEEKERELMVLLPKERELVYTIIRKFHSIRPQRSKKHPWRRLHWWWQRAYKEPSRATNTSATKEKDTKTMEKTVNTSLAPMSIEFRNRAIGAWFSVNCLGMVYRPNWSSHKIEIMILSSPEESKEHTQQCHQPSRGQGSEDYSSCIPYAPLSRSGSHLPIDDNPID